MFDAAVVRAEELLGYRLIYDCVDPQTGEITSIVIVTDNGPAMKSDAVARWFKARSHFTIKYNQTRPYDRHLKTPNTKTTKT